MLQYYRQSKITPVHFPIHDFNEEDLKSKLFEGASILNEMINKEGLKVCIVLQEWGELQQ
jgi:hypothetical protein